MHGANIKINILSLDLWLLEMLVLFNSADRSTVFGVLEDRIRFYR